MIRLNKIKKYYGPKKIIDIDELFLERGKITSIIGENGLGKSTLLRIIAGIEQRYSGEVEYEFNFKEMTLLQHPPVLLNRSVYDNIAYPLEVRGYKKEEIDKKVGDLLKTFNIEYLKEKNGKKLSSGESQKVAFARGVSFDPKVLLLDEPFANLDYTASETLKNYIKKYNKEKELTIILVTHQRSFVADLSHKIIKLGDIMEK